MKKSIFKKWWFWLIIVLITVLSKSGIAIFIIIYFFLKERKIKKNIETKNNIINKNIRENNELRVKNEIIDTYVAGTSYNESNVNKLFNDILEYEEPYDGYTDKEIIEEYNDYFSNSDRIYQVSNTSFEIVKLQKEPENKYDSNAIKVMYDDLKLGYVPKDININVLSKFEKIKEVRVYPRGGQYKYVNEDEEGNIEIKTNEIDKGLNMKIEFIR